MNDHLPTDHLSVFSALPLFGTHVQRHEQDHPEDGCREGKKAAAWVVWRLVSVRDRERL